LRGLFRSDWSATAATSANREIIVALGRAEILVDFWIGVFIYFILLLFKAKAVEESGRIVDSIFACGTVEYHDMDNIL
jgi:hypothetical protein